MGIVPDVHGRSEPGKTVVLAPEALLEATRRSVCPSLVDAQRNAGRCHRFAASWLRPSRAESTKRQTCSGSIPSARPAQVVFLGPLPRVVNRFGPDDRPFLKPVCAPEGPDFGHGSGLVELRTSRSFALHVLNSTESDLAAARAPRRRRLDLVETIPSFDWPSACVILVETGPGPHAYISRADRLASWAGVWEGNNESTGKRRSGCVRKGIRYLRVGLTACAHDALRTKGTQCARCHLNVAARRGYWRSILAPVNKLLRTIDAVQRIDGHYRDSGIDDEQLHVQRNALAGEAEEVRYLPETRASTQAA